MRLSLSEKGFSKVRKAWPAVGRELKVARMQKWYIVMAKPGQGHSSTSILGQAGIETYYPEVKECLNVGGRRRFRRSGLFPGYFSRVSTMSESIGLFLIPEGAEK